ncbi:hypothetical protein Hanom_Chr00s000004g01608721 [Helianthus anomalus]
MFLINQYLCIKYLHINNKNRKKKTGREITEVATSSQILSECNQMNLLLSAVLHFYAAVNEALHPPSSSFYASF